MGAKISLASFSTNATRDVVLVRSSLAADQFLVEKKSNSILEEDF